MNFIKNPWVIAAIVAILIGIIIFLVWKGKQKTKNADPVSVKGKDENGNDVSVNPDAK